MPVASDNRTPGKRKTLAGLLGATAAASLFGVVAGWEGKSNDPYKDIVGIWTVCHGETQGPMRRFTDAECKTKLEDRLVDYAGPVLDRNPELRGRDNQIVAASSLAYNIGVGNYRSSTVAKRFSARDWKGGCDAIRSWNRATFPTKQAQSYSACIPKKGGGYSCVVKGLDNRRRDEQALCLRDL